MKYLVFCVLLFSTPYFAFSQNSDKTQKKDITKSKQSKTMSSETVSVSVNASTTTSISDVDDEKTEVLIDTGFSFYQSQSSFEGQDQSGDSIPYYIGVFKGVFVFEGKNLLVFEGDDGTINFVQIFREGTKIRWKIYLQLRRV